MENIYYLLFLSFTKYVSTKIRLLHAKSYKLKYIYFLVEEKFIVGLFLKKNKERKKLFGAFFLIQAIGASDESEFTIRCLSEVKNKFIFANVQSRPF